MRDGGKAQIALNSVKVRDPFGTVDASNNPETEETILLARYAGSYYTDVLDWFFAAGRKQPGRILEVGCGTGHVLERLAQRSIEARSEFFGVDLSTYLIEHAERTFPAFRFSPADGRALFFEDNSFDLVFAATVLVHSNDPGTIVSEMRRVTKRGGVVALLDQDFETAVLHPGEPALTRRVLNAAADFWNDGWIGRKLPGMLSKAGLQDIRVGATVRIDRDCDLPFFRRIHDWIVKGGFSSDEAARWLRGLETAEKEDFLFSRNFYAALAVK